MDKTIGELIAAQNVNPTDLFILQQGNDAKSLSGQVLETWLLTFAEGRGGIQSIQLKSTAGLVDTYRITFSDATFTDFTVTNGEKGNKGDNAYAYVKYASTDPSIPPHSFGDIPDAWMGIYAGKKSTAPTLWSDYKWYKIKGEKGDIGNPSTLESNEVKYQLSSSGTLIPSGDWLDSIPNVPQGKYLWTRVKQTFNTGEPVIFYSISRMGVDGLGTVKTICNISPDSEGNISLNVSNLAGSENLEKKPIRVTGIDLPGSSFESYTAITPEETKLYNSGYVYRAEVYVSGVDASMFPYITFSLPSMEETGADIANQFNCVTNGVYIYSREAVVGTINILTIECRR